MIVLALGTAMFSVVNSFCSSQFHSKIQTAGYESTATVCGRTVTTMILAVVGIFGRDVLQRRSAQSGNPAEDGAGAEAGQVLRMVVWEGSDIATYGIAIGVVGSIAVARVMAGQLFEIASSDLLKYLTISSLLIGVARLASPAGSACFWGRSHHELRHDPWRATRFSRL